MTSRTQDELGEDLIGIKQPVFSNNDDFTLSVFNRKFDFILAHSIFSHASQPQIRRCLSEAKKVMKPTSIFVAFFIKGKRNYTGNEWSYYPGCITYTLEHMIDLVEEQGLVCKPTDWPHPYHQTWITIVHPEAEQISSNACPCPRSGILYLDELDHSAAIPAKGGTAKLLNVTGQLLWTLCDGTRTRQDILQALKAHFDDVAEEVLARDLDEFITDLFAQGFLRLPAERRTDDQHA